MMFCLIEVVLVPVDGPFISPFDGLVVPIWNECNNNLFRILALNSLQYK